MKANYVMAGSFKVEDCGNCCSIIDFSDLSYEVDERPIELIEDGEKQYFCCKSCLEEYLKMRKEEGSLAS